MVCALKDGDHIGNTHSQEHKSHDDFLQKSILEYLYTLKPFERNAKESRMCLWF